VTCISPRWASVRDKAILTTTLQAFRTPLSMKRSLSSDAEQSQGKRPRKDSKDGKDSERDADIAIAEVRDAKHAEHARS